MQHGIAAAEPGVRVALRRSVPRLAVQWVIATLLCLVEIHVGTDAMFGDFAQVLVGRAAMAAFVR
jgi:hypothetical protein